ncbi:MAG: type VI secretion system lipoprotein TssJ [Endozoicomonas sp.]
MGSKPLFLLLCLCLSGCASWFQKETQVRLTIKASDQINPGNTSDSNPLFIQVLQLKDTARFQQADFLNLYKNLSATLGDELVYLPPAIPVRPGETLEQIIKPEPGSQYIGLIYFFSQYQQSTTRHWLSIEPSREQCIQVNLSNTLATISQKCP